MAEDSDTTNAVLPYAGSSGWSGTDTSHRRAHEDDGDGTTTRRQRITLAALSGAGPGGLTWKELSRVAEWHHGQASGVLTILHMSGRISRLREKRNRCRVYVLPEYVNDRETEPYVRQSRQPAPATTEEMAELIREAYMTLDALGVFDDE